MSMKISEHLVNKYPSSEALKECSTYCYDACVRDFKGLLVELTVDSESASYDAFVAGDEPNNCDKQLAAEKIQLAAEKIVNDPSISALNDEMKFLSFIANTMISHLQ
ncbi:hypothetical protein P8452_72723 [Trifolium repens]|nr:hypothetical protein P8452_72723 [Trifolium repens]